jgi:hypothetical protein
LLKKFYRAEWKEDIDMGMGGNETENSLILAFAGPTEF